MNKLLYIIKLKNIKLINNINNNYFNFIWGLGIGDWAQSPIPNPQSPIPNPQSPINPDKLRKIN